MLYNNSLSVYNTHCCGSPPIITQIDSYSWYFYCLRMINYAGLLNKTQQKVISNIIVIRGTTDAANFGTLSSLHI